MKLGKLTIGVLLLIFFACKSNSPREKTSENPIIQKNQVEFDSLKFPKPLGYVSDFENVFTEQQAIELDKIITDYERLTTREIAIVSTSSIKPYNNFKDYGMDLSNEWGIGKADKDNGLLILFSSNLKELRITTGFGTEKVLTDNICQNILDETLTLYLKKGQYYEGIKYTLLELIKKWE